MAGHPIARVRRSSQSLRDLIAIAFTTRGRPADGDGKQLSTEELVACVLGLRAGPVEAAAVGSALEGMDLERDGDCLRWQPTISRRTRASDSQLLVEYIKTAERARTLVRRHLGPMHLRWLEGWKSASRQKQSSYEAARSKARMYGVLPAELPEGYTWVEEHTRGYWE